jgi:hypothetical protein
MVLLLLGCDPGVNPVVFTASAPSGAVARAARQNVLTSWVGILEYAVDTAGATTMTAATSADAYCETAVVLRANETAAAPVNTVEPTLSGTSTETFQMSCTTGTWTGNPTPTFTYQWQRDTPDEPLVTWENISGATASTYTLTASETLLNVRCGVTATNSAGSATAYSDPDFVDPTFVGPLYVGAGAVAMIVCGEGVGVFDEGDDPEDPPPPELPGTDFFTDHVPPRVFAFADASPGTFALADATATALVFADHTPDS